MAKQINVLGENRRVKKCVAQLLVNRLIADWVIQNVSIRMKPLREFNPKPIELQHKIRRPATYEHHIEPRIERLSPANSPWLAYLNGLRTISTRLIQNSDSLLSSDSL